MNLSIKEFSKKAKVRVSTQTAVENGSKPITGNYLIRICEIPDINLYLDDLLTPLTDQDRVDLGLN